MNTLMVSGEEDRAYDTMRMAGGGDGHLPPRLDLHSATL